VEALILAAALRVVGPAVQEIDAELDEPHTEPGEALSRAVAPRRAVVDEHRIRQAILAKGPVKGATHRGLLFIGTGGKADGIARVVVHHRQRMASLPIGERHPAFEVHLPQKIWSFLLEPPEWTRRAERRDHPAMAAQDLMHGRTRWRAALPFETTHNLACSPGRVSIAHRKYALFRHRVTAAGHRMWTTRAIGQLSIAALPSPKPLVADVRADPEPPAQLTYVRALLHCQSDKLTPLVHDRHLLPRHERPPSRAESCHL